MPLGAAIELTLYDDDDAVISTYHRARIPMMFAERAMELGPQLETPGPDQIKAMYQLIVEFFGDKFTVDQLRKGADLGELYAVVYAIMARAGELMPANTTPFPKGKKTRRKVSVKDQG
jgi:hypothetical protein